MKIAIPKEKIDGENRVAASPEVAGKLVGLGFDVTIEEGAGLNSSFSDDAYKDAGTDISKDMEEALKTADMVWKVRAPSVKEMNGMKKGAILLANLDALTNLAGNAALAKAEITAFAMELMPRISRAQSMDILSSQANLAGYKAVIDAFSLFKKAIPMMMTAAGTIPAAKVLVVGAGVAGLQAIATAKRMGAIVFATDVRIASKEQVESLGGKFLVVEDDENLETESGYAKEVTDNFKKKQEDLLIETLKKIDIVICTALIPGKKAPRIINEKMIENMQAGSVIYDLAASQGGNSAYTKVDEVVEKDGITIIGESTILNKLPTSASNLYAKNLFNFVLNLYDKKKKKININMEDEIINKTFVK